MSYKQGTFSIPANPGSPVPVPFGYDFGAPPELVLITVTTGGVSSPVDIQATVGAINAQDFELVLGNPPTTTGYGITWIAGDQADVVAALTASKQIKSDYLSIEEMRMFLLDQKAEDNALDLDLSFSDEEILSAMKRAAREYNSIPPFVSSVDYRRLPNDTNVFLHATAEQIYIAELARAKRNDMDYTAGNVSANLEQKRITHFEGLVKFHREIWTDTATKIKVAANLAKAYRSF